MFADLDAFKEEITTRDERNFVSRYLFETVPFLFGDDIELWVNWKTKLGTLLEVDPRDIVLTGSSAIGFSLSPKKNFKRFDDQSDIDCGIISPHHFDIAWRYLRQQRSEWLTLHRDVKAAITVHRTNYVFAGTIATDWILPLLPFGSSWGAALATMSQLEPTVGREVKLRIYKDFDALRGYQSVGIRDAKGRCALEDAPDASSLDSMLSQEITNISTEDA